MFSRNFKTLSLRASSCLNLSTVVVTRQVDASVSADVDDQRLLPDGVVLPDSIFQLYFPAALASAHR